MQKKRKQTNKKCQIERFISTIKKGTVKGVSLAMPLIEPLGTTQLLQLLVAVLFGYFRQC